VLDRLAYVDSARFALEQRALRRRFVAFAHESEVAEPGALVCRSVLGERVVVARTASLELAAFVDGCLHRRALLVSDGVSRCSKLELECPYHGLRYRLDGKVEPSMTDRFRLPADARLPPVEVRSRWGFVFVRLERGPADPEDLPLGPPWFERAELAALRRAYVREDLVRANWKLLVENFQESHHFPRVHPSLERATPHARSTSVTLGGGFLGGSMELEPRHETVSEDGRLHGRPFVAGIEDRRCVRDALLFPTWLTSLQPDYFLSYRLAPRSVAETLVTAEIFFHAAAFHERLDVGAVTSFWDRTNAEDRAIVELQQRGLSESSHEPGPLAPSEDGIAAFHALLAELSSAPGGGASA
jgi:Rieske 2Fe-2S family protein